MNTIKIEQGATQCDKIIYELYKNTGEWVPMPQLVDCSGSYNVHSRIADLRLKGHTIEQKNRRVGMKTLSFYKLEKFNVS